jgi:chromosome segregation ATPase
MKVSTENMRARALALLKAVQRKGHPELDFISLALQGKKMGFEKVIKMIDEMVATLKTEQQDDDHKKEYCAELFDLMDDKKKGLERSISDLETAIAKEKDGIAQAVADIDALGDSIRALDKSVAEATEQRKEEHEGPRPCLAQGGSASRSSGARLHHPGHPGQEDRL